VCSYSLIVGVNAFVDILLPGTEPDPEPSQIIE
jgi:hypothetical protein